jgi:hypothetical protein
MKISKAINLFIDYHRLNSQKKYEPYLWRRIAEEV